MNDLLTDRTAKFFKKNKKNKVQKLVLAGSGAVGKTSLLRVLKENKILIQYQEDELEYLRTPFIEIETIKVSDIKLSGNSSPVDVEGKIIFCDLAGQMDLPIHALQELNVFVLSKTNIVLLLFANNNAQSFLELPNWIEKIKDFYYARELPYPYFFLVKNKSDLEPPAMDINFINMMIESEPLIMNFLEISCATGEGVNEFKNFLIKLFQ